MTTDHSSSDHWSVWQECRTHWRLYLVVLLVTAIIVGLVSHSFPKEYAAQVTLIDETAESDILIGLNNIAAAQKLSAQATADPYKSPYNPEVYAQLLKQTVFAEEMSKVYIPYKEMTYGEYLISQVQKPWWKKMWDGITGDSHTGYENQQVISTIQSLINYQLKNRSRIIVIEVRDQDPIVAAQLVDSVREHLVSRLNWIRGEKLRREVSMAEARAATALQRYEDVSKTAAEFEESHQNSINKHDQALIDQYDEDKDHANLSYRSAMLQYSRSIAFMKKEPSDFTVIESARILPSAISPNPFVNILVAVIVMTVITSWYILLRRKYRRKKT
jgi:uncharacterized protein involved in exopolysaccharide biosynthesis